MTTVEVFSGTTLGSAALNFNLPVRRGLAMLHIPTPTYFSSGSGGTGTTLLNMAYPNAPASVVVGSPTFDTQGMSVNAYGDGLRSSVFDSQNDLTIYGIFKVTDSDSGTGNLPIFASSYATDASGALTGSKGVTLQMLNNSGSTTNIFSVARTSNVATVILNSVPSPVWTNGQLVTVSGVTVDPSINTTLTALTMGVNGKTFSYASVGPNLTAVSPGGGAAWNGQGTLELTDTINSPTGTVAISAISRSGTTVTATVGSIPAGLSAGGPVTIAGVTGDTTYNGTWTALTATGTTITYTSPGTAGSGVVAVATAALAVNNRLITPQLSGALFNVPRFLAATINSVSGTRTLYDFSTGGSSPVVAVQTGSRIGTTTALTSFFFGSGLFSGTFGLHKQFAQVVHIATPGNCLTQAELAQNYATLALRTGVG